MRVVDPHVHIWDLSTKLYPHFETPTVGFSGDNSKICRTYLVEELLQEGKGEIEIAKIVNVEAFPTDKLAETRYLQDLAGRTGYPQGIVAGCDLSLDDAESVLAAQAAFANVRGIRHVLNRHSNPLFNYVAKDFLAIPAWRANFGLLRKYGLSFDMQLYPHQFAAALEVVKAHPDIQVIVNHAGMFADRTLAGWRQWRDGIRALAGVPNIAIKISGLGMLDPKWTLESFRPYVLEILDAFGLQRCMFASNFPVDGLFATYVEVWRTFAAITADLSDDERRGLFSANAERIYRI